MSENEGKAFPNAMRKYSRISLQPPFALTMFLSNYFGGCIVEQENKYYICLIIIPGSCHRDNEISHCSGRTNLATPKYANGYRNMYSMYSTQKRVHDNSVPDT